MKPSKAFISMLLLCVSSSVAFPQDKPNIVLVFMDNFGWGEPGFNGGGIIRGAATPRLDQLAAEGLRLTNFNVEVQCTPSRSAIMTGRYADQKRQWRRALGRRRLRTCAMGSQPWPKCSLMPDTVRACSGSGIWAVPEGRFPTDQGFDEWYGVPNSTDESAYTALQGFAESGVEESFVMEARKGEKPNVSVYR